MRAKSKLFLLLLLIGVVPALIASYSIYTVSRASWEYDKVNDLMNVVDAKYIHILDFLHMTKGEVRTIGDNELVYMHLQDYYAGVKPEKQIAALSSYLTDIQKNSLLEEHAQKNSLEQRILPAEVFGRRVKLEMFRIFERIHRYDEVMILDNKGKVIASSKNSSIGMDLSADEFFTRGKNETFIKDVYKDYAGKFVFGFAAPIKENMGVVVLKVPIEYLNDVATGDVGNQIGGKLFFAGIGDTEEYYIANKDGMMITEPKSLVGKDVILEKKASTLPVERCMIGGEAVNGKVVTKSGGAVRESQETSVNYNGVSVGVASMCVFEMNWTVIGEQHTDEIFSFKGVGTVKSITTGILVVTILLSLALAFFFSEHIIVDILEQQK